MTSVNPDTRVEVPQLIGLVVPEARRVAHHLGLVVTSANVDGPPLGALTWPGVWVVTGQVPKAGERARRGSMIVVSFEKREDGGGVREPRRPAPEPPSLRRSMPEAPAGPAAPDSAAEPGRSLEQPGQAPVGQDLPAGLAGRAVLE